jgi:glycine oxidase
MKNDVVVVGGGVIGCSIALRLAQQGLKVVLVERGRLGCEASRAAAGMLSPQAEAMGPSPFFDFCMKSRALYPNFARELAELSGIDPEYRDEGTLAVRLERTPLDHFQQWTGWQKDAGLHLENLGEAEIHALAPALGPGAIDGVFLQGDHQIDNRRLMDALAAALANNGVQVVEGEMVEAIEFEATNNTRRAVGVRSRSGRISAGVVVIAAGCWSSQLLGLAGLRVITEPARGQMLALRGDSTVFDYTLNSGHCYLVPRRDGRVVVGSTVEYTGFQKAVTAEAIGSLLNAATELAPVLAGFELIETWCGLRPDTSDHLPILGRSGIDNLILATGHFRNGILLAPATADLIVEVITQGRSPVDMAPFGVERFEAAARGAPTSC